MNFPKITLLLLITILLFIVFFFFSSRRRHTRSLRDWSSDVYSSDLSPCNRPWPRRSPSPAPGTAPSSRTDQDRKSTRLNSSHVEISYAVFCLKKKKKIQKINIIKFTNHSITIYTRQCTT